jgi:HTH-type transcriptional repressor of NAD biosynthesis genes
MQSMHQSTGTNSMLNNKTWGLVVGKFAPYHKGHQYLLSEATKRCDNLIILSYANPDFGFDARQRMSAIERDFPEADLLFAEDANSTNSLFDITESLDIPLPSNDDCDYVHRAYTTDVLLGNMPGLKLDYVFSSEDYGDGFAEYLSFRMQTPVKHVMIDKERKNFPVSATKIRSGELDWDTWSLLNKH